MLNRRSFLRALGAAAVAPGIAWGQEAGAPPAALPPTPYNPFGNPAHGARPNIILVLCDDLGWGEVGAFREGKPGPAAIPTPNLDRACAEGARLTDHAACAPVCAPARASLMTGKNQGHCTVRDGSFDHAIDPRMTLATVLGQAGYATWHIGKWGLGGGYQAGTPHTAMPCQAGFDYAYFYPAHLHGHSYYHCLIPGVTDLDAARTPSFLLEAYSPAAYAAAGAPDGFAPDGEGAGQWRRPVANAEARFVYDTDLFTAKAKALIRAHRDGPQRDRPFFLSLCHTAIHGSGAKAVQDPAIRCAEPFHVPGGPYPAPDGEDPLGGGARLGDPAIKASAETANTWIDPRFRDRANPSLRRYATALARLDDAMGDLLHFLKVAGIDRDTLLVFTSDNGPSGEYLDPGPGLDARGTGIDWVERVVDANGPFRGAKCWVYQGGLRVPTLVRWPAHVAPGVCDLPSDHACWLPTFAEAAGLPAPARADGVSLLPALTRYGRQLPCRLYAEFYDHGSGQGFGFGQTVRQGDWALVRNAAKHGGKPELYDLRADPGQTRDLAAERPELLASLLPLLRTCRIPTARTRDAQGAERWAQCDCPGRTALDAEPLPPLPEGVPTPPTALWLYQGSWPWVPDFRTLLPVHQVPAERIAAILPRLPRAGVGILFHTTLDLPEDATLTLRAEGPGGCHVWIHEAHVLDYEAGACLTPRAYPLALRKGRHPIRAALTAPFVTLTLDGKPLIG